MKELQYPVRPGRYRHFKGNEYQVLGVARHSETEEEMVVYRALYGEGGLWVRPAAMDSSGAQRKEFSLQGCFLFWVHCTRASGKRCSSSGQGLSQIVVAFPSGGVEKRAFGPLHLDQQGFKTLISARATLRDIASLLLSYSSVSQSFSLV